MARSAATVEAELDALRAIRGSGELRVTYDGKTVEFRSGADLDRAITALMQELAALNGNLRRKIHVTDSPRMKGWA